MNPVTTEVPHTLREQVTSWINSDICEASKQELWQLLKKGNVRELLERMAGPLEFGTAGLRGELGAGPNRMNLAVVVKSCAGIAEYLLKTNSDTRKLGIVIGHDARRMGREFCEAAASVFAAYDVPVHMFSISCPTPLVAYATKRLRTAAGIMVTASHNPPQYNGMKVYWSNGAQIIPPHDKGMAAEIAALPGASDCKRIQVALARERGLIKDISTSLIDEYLDEVATLSTNSATGSKLSIVYTPLHGVGKDLACRALTRAGCAQVHVVAEQAVPDGGFPTVTSPNPEDTSALALAIELASANDSELVLANDPDADRLAVAVRHPLQPRYVHLTGNQVGVLIAQYLLEQSHFAQSNSLYITTIVSSPMLKAMAAANNVRFEEVLPGFKWIANKAMDHEAQNSARFVFGYEEAIGYTIGSVVRDKDGISATAIFGELTAFYEQKGVSILDKLKQMYQQYGLYVSSQHSITRPGLQGAEEIRQIMQRLRDDPPARIGDVPVIAWTDYDQGVCFHNSGSQTKLDLPRSNTLRFELEDSSRVIARPSGTEPKIKFYFDVCAKIDPSEDFTSAEARADEQLETLKKDFLSMLPC